MPEFILPANLARLGIKRVVENPNKRLIVSTRAQPKCGKTHFATTAPGPIFYLNIDQGDEGVVDKQIAKNPHKAIYKKDLFIPKGGKDRDHAKLWKEFTDTWEAVIDSGKFRTVAVDTAGDLWELLRLVRFGKLEQVPPEKYGPVTIEYCEMMNLPKQDPTLNAVYIHKLKKQYSRGGKKADGGQARGDWTGQWELKGCAELSYVSQVNIEQYRLDQFNGIRPFGIRVIDSRVNPDCDGLELTTIGPGPINSPEDADPTMDVCDFANLGLNLYSDSEPKDWE